MDQGKLLTIDSPAQLKTQVPGGYVIDLHVRSVTAVNTNLATSLRTLPGVVDLQATDNLIRLCADKAEGLLVSAMRVASEQGVLIADAHVSDPSLENLFLRLTGRSLRD